MKSNLNLNIFTDFSPVAEGQLKNLNPLLSFHWHGLEKNAIFSGDYNSNSPMDLTDDAEKADIFVLPMHWSYYLWNGKAKMSEATRLAELAHKHQKQIIVWHKGDLVPIVPFENGLVFLPGLVKSEARQNQRACPAFIEDPEPVFRNGHDRYRKKKDKPSVGFCGYASVRAPKALWAIAKGLQLNLSSRLGRYDYAEVPIMPATIKRARALRRVSRHPDLEARFVIRDKHTESKSQKGALGNKEISHAFFSNIYQNDYTLCIRGYGNWSYRFYETLACGRIPVFVDTDCVLPSSSSIDWKSYCVWVDHSELGQIGEKIADFHSSLSAVDFVDLQAACRKLWQSKLTLSGFMTQLREHYVFV